MFTTRLIMTAVIMTIPSLWLSYHMTILALCLFFHYAYPVNMLIPSL